MPAQILPIFDEAAQGLDQMSRLEDIRGRQADREYNQRSQEMKFQNQQALAPYRQALLQSEIDKNGQAQEASVAAILRANQTADSESERRGLENALTEEQTRKATSEADISSFNLDDMRQHLTEGGMRDLQARLRTQDLTKGEEELVKSRSADIASIALQKDRGVRQAMLQPRVENGSITQEQADAILNASPKTEDLEQDLADTLSPAALAKFRQLHQAANVKPFTIQDIAEQGLNRDDAKAANKTILEAQRGLHEIMTQYFNAKDAKQATHELLEIGDVFGKSKIKRIGTIQGSTKKAYLLENGKTVDSSGKEI